MLPIGGKFPVASAFRLLPLMVTAYVSRVQRPSRHIRPVGLPQDLQLLVGAMRSARIAPLAGRQPPSARRF